MRVVHFVLYWGSAKHKKRSMGWFSLDSPRPVLLLCAYLLISDTSWENIALSLQLNPEYIHWKGF